MARNRSTNRRRRRGRFSFLTKLLCILLIAGAVVAALTVFFKVQSITVSGNARYTSEEVVAASGIEIEDNLFLLNKYSAAQAIFEKLPYVEEATINRALPDTIVITVRECAAGKGKAEEAARMAISSPLLETSIHGARGVLINVTGSMDIGLEEVEQAASLVQDAVHPDALTIFGATFDESMDYEIRVTVIATGFADGKSAAAAAPAEEKKAAEAKPGIEPINYEEDKAAAEAEKKTEEEDDPFADIFKIFNRER